VPLVASGHATRRETTTVGDAGALEVAGTHMQRIAYRAAMPRARARRRAAAARRSAIAQLLLYGSLALSIRGQDHSQNIFHCTRRTAPNWCYEV
jgi:hypothetical protein